MNELSDQSKLETQQGKTLSLQLLVQPSEHVVVCSAVTAQLWD